MTADRTDDRYRDWDAAYVLGALPSDERLEYERHLETCAACRDAVAELAGVPGILGRLTAEDALALDAPAEAGREARPPASRLQDVAHVAGRRRRRRRTLTAVVAALAVVVAVLGGVALGVARGPVAVTAGTAYVMQPVHEPAVLTADIRVTGKAWGTRFDWSCSYGAGGWATDTDEQYDLVVTRTDGAQRVVATWSAVGEHAGDLAAATGIPLRSIRSVDIRLHDSAAPLVRSNL